VKMLLALLAGTAFFTTDVSAQSFESVSNQTALLPLGFSLILVLALVILRQWKSSYFLLGLFSSLIAFLAYNQLLTNIVPETWMILTSGAIAIVTLILWCRSLNQQLNSESVQNNHDEEGRSTASLKLHLDPVTQLPNYPTAISVLNRTENPEQLVAAVLKPTNFADINKTLGHQNADLLLLELMYNLSKVLEANEHLVEFGNNGKKHRLARLQGVDFLFVVDSSTSHHPVETIVEDICNQILQAVPKAMSFRSFSLHFELAFGIAVAKGLSSRVEEIVAYAGDAVLEARTTTNKIQYFNKSKVVYSEIQLQKMAQLKKDIADKNILWFAQPQTYLASGELVGVEVSHRWLDEENNIVEKQEFRRIAKHSGESYHLTRLMIEETFKLLFEIHNKFKLYVPATINLTSEELLEVELLEFMENQSENFNIPLSYIVIGLNETLLLSDSVKAKFVIDKMRSMGIKVAIDEFSGSYESLRYLRRLAVHQVKVDCASLGEPVDKSNDRTIVKALINLTRKMELPIMATHIDSEDILATYIATGSSMGQGNIINSPVSIDKFNDWMQQWLIKYPVNVKE